MADTQKKMEEPSRLGIHPEEKRWFAVYTRYKREKLVTQQLRQKGIEAYVPLQEFTRYYTRKIKKVQLPLISCYIFVRINKSDYVRVLETPDVVTFIRFDSRLVAIPEQEIKILRQVVGEDQEIMVSREKVEVGQRAEIIGGRLTGLKGRILKDHGDKNFIIELDSLNYNLHMQVPKKYLQPIRKR
jgi:transcription antitermination factor NusG